MEPSDFSPQRLRRLLRRSLALGYAPLLHGEEHGRDGRFVLWRHDVDLELEAAVRMAELEHAEGVRATYFLMASGAFYNLFSPQGEAAVAALLALGHGAALHVDLLAARDAADITDAAIRARVARERALVEAFYPDAFLPAVSFHNPPAAVVGRDVPGVESAYAARFFGPIRYCSDSKRRFRDGPPEQLLEEGYERLSILLHPVLWAYGGSTMPEGLAGYLAERDARTRAQLSAGGAEL